MDYWADLRSAVQNGHYRRAKTVLSSCRNDPYFEDMVTYYILEVGIGVRALVSMTSYALLI